jgi:hypothetical protein
LRTTFKLLPAIDPPKFPFPLQSHHEFDHQHLSRFGPKPCPLQPAPIPPTLLVGPRSGLQLHKLQIPRRTPSWLRRSGRSAAAGAVARPPPPLPRPRPPRVTRGTR